MGLRGLVAGLGMLSALCCGGCTAEPQENGVARFSINGGTTVEPGAWPMVGWLDNGCSGVLLSPQLVVFAAHCGMASALWLGDDFEVVVDDDAGTARPLDAPAGSEHSLGECQLHPDGSLTSGTDVAWCRSSAPALPAQQVISPLLGCAREALGPESVRLVGFGSDEASDAVGTKRETTAEISVLGRELEIGNAEAGTCPGDSGSPAFVQLAEAPRSDWGLLGILSSGLADEACGSGAYTDLSAVVGWLEDSSGEDLSPCHAPDGAWTPSARCHKAAIDREGQPTSKAPARSELCGAPYEPPAEGCALARCPSSFRLELALLLAFLAWVARKRAQSQASLQATTAHSM